MRIFFFVLFLINSCAFGSFGAPWNSGVVVLQDQQVLVGEISYTAPQDIILFRSGGETSVLTPYKVQMFRYYDLLADINRQFVTLEQKDGPASYFEVVIEGPLKVLRHPRSTPFAINDEIAGYRYFTWDGSALEPISKFRARIYPELLEENATEIKDFVLQHRLNPGEFEAALLIIKEYNRIEHKRPVMAMVN